MIRTRLAVLVLGLALAISGCATGTPPASATPWMVTLAESGPGSLVTRFSCGGALVEPDKVITAAHCVEGLKPEELGTLEYHVGARTLSFEPGYTARVRAVATEPGYRLLPSPVDPRSREFSSATHDVAVVTLDAPVPGAVPLAIAAGPPATGETATLYGHGYTSPTSGTTDALKEIPYRIDTPTACASGTPAVVDASTMVCGRGTSQAFACFGDSGGPIVHRAADGRPELIGVMSFAMETAGAPCGTPGPNFFAGLTADRAWLDAQLR